MSKNTTKTAQGPSTPQQPCRPTPLSQYGSKIPDFTSVGSKIKFDQMLKNLKKSSFTKQLLLGAASGWITGVATMRVGKFTTCALGSGILIYQIAQHQGLITIDWNEVKQRAEQKKKDFADKYSKKTPTTIVKLQAFAKSNRVFAAAFLGGFLIGLGS